MFRKSLIALTVVGALSTQAYANEINYQRPQFTQLNLIFENADQPMQLAVLSQREMMETEGAFVPWVIGGVVGAASGSLGYLGHYLGSGGGDWNWAAFGITTLTATLTGAMSGGMSSLAAVGIPVVSYVGGLSAGTVSRPGF